MLKLRIRCISKNTGEVFYEYHTKTLFNLVEAKKKMSVASSVFFNRLIYGLNEDCTFELTVLHCSEELPIEFDSSEIDDYNKTPVVF